MSDEQDLNAQRTRMMEIWHEYGQTFNSFVPEEQPFPDEWEPEVPEVDDKRRLSPQALKHWDQLFPTKDFYANDTQTIMFWKGLPWTLTVWSPNSSVACTIGLRKMNMEILCTCPS
jgi:hypothetical protein